MAKVSGASAYQQLRPINDGMSQAQQYWGKLKAGQDEAELQRAHQRDLAEGKIRATKDAAAKVAFDERYGITPEDTYLQESEFGNLNDAYSQEMSLHRDNLYTQQEKLKLNPNDEEAKIAFNKSKNSVKNLQELNTSMVKIGEDLLQKELNGKLSGVDKDRWREIKVSHENGKYKVKLDENGESVYMFYNETDDGGYELGNVVNRRELLGGEVYDEIDIEQRATDIATELGREVIDTATGGKIVTYDEWDEAKQGKALDDLLNVYLNNDSIVADVLHQLDPTSMQRTKFDIAQKDKVRDFLTEAVKDKYGREKKIKSGGNSYSWTRNKDEQSATWLFDITNRVYAGEEEAFGSLKNIKQTSQPEGSDTAKTRVSSEVVIVDGNLIVMDNVGNKMLTVRLDGGEASKMQIANFIKGGANPDKVLATYELGRQTTGGKFEVGDKAKSSTMKESPDIDTTKIDDLPTDSDKAKNFLKGEYTDDGFKFSTTDKWFEDNEVVITAESGNKKMFKLTDKEGIKKFLEDNSPTKKTYTKNKKSNNKKKSTPISN